MKNVNSKSNILNSRSGFTLIEMLIVVAIIGLLSSVILVGLGGFRGKGQDTRRMADIRQIQNGLELYYSKNRNYPNPNTWSSDLIAAGIGIQSLPHDPVSKNEYLYATNGQSYVLGATVDAGNSALNDSVKVLPTGAGWNNNSAASGISSCASPIYCVQF